MKSNNVIMFPNNKVKNQGPKTLEEINNNMDMIRQVHVGETISTIAPMLFEQLAIAGFEFSEDGSDLKHGAFLVESIRSLLMHSYEMGHPFQEIAESVFIPEGDGLRITDKLDIVFKHNLTIEPELEDE